MTATTTPAEIAYLTDEQLVDLVSNVEDDGTLDELLAEIDRREAEPTDVEEVDQQEVGRAMVETERREGETLNQAVDRMYYEWSYLQYMAAEEATNGYMLNKAGQAAGVDPYSLFNGSAKRAAKYMSEELRDWWAENRRLTAIEYRAMMLNRPGEVAKARATREVAHSYGL